jgi:hypothetical protein
MPLGPQRDSSPLSPTKRHTTRCNARHTAILHSHEIDPRRNDRRVTDEQLPVRVTQREHHVSEGNEEGPRRDERAVPVFVEEGAGERGEEEGEEALGAVWVLALVLPRGFRAVP